MNESDTRLHKIDPKLKATGWGVTEGIQAMRVIPSGSFSSGCMHRGMTDIIKTSLDW